MAANTNGFDYFRLGTVLPYLTTLVDNFTFDYFVQSAPLDAMAKSNIPGPTLSIKYKVDDFTTWKQGVKIYTP